MLNRHYESELDKLRALTVEFSKANPALAPMLAATSSDPDVERLLEGVAFLTGLARQKLDDEFPEFVQEIANLLFPHFLRPVPASTLIAFTPRGAQHETVTVAAGTELASLPIDGTVCIFRTCGELKIPPLQLLGAALESGLGLTPRIVLDFVSPMLEVDALDIDRLRLFLAGGYNEATRLLLILTRFVARLRIECGKTSFSLPASALAPAGFDLPLLDYPGNAFPGYRTVQEFFVQPEKFLFLDLTGLNALRECGGNHFRIVAELTQLPAWMPEVHAGSFLINVVPAVNLFPHSATPIAHQHRVAEYRIAPEGQRPGQYRIFSVNEVIGYRQGQSEQRNYLPFGTIGEDSGLARRSFRSTLRPAAVGRGAEVYLSLTHPPEEELAPETLSIALTCTNHTLPEGLKIGDISQPTSTSPDRMAFANIRPVSAALEPPLGEKLLWRLLSHAALNFLSLAEAANLRTLLGLYVFSERGERTADIANRRRIDGIESVTVSRDTRLIGRGSLLRGQRIQIACRLDHYAGEGDLFLFGCVLERFLADYAAANAFTRVELTDTLSGVSFQWPPRLGNQILL